MKSNDLEDSCDADNFLSSVGFMFDASHSKITKVVKLSEDLSISLRTIGDNPGHVQSGQYLWPAAVYASKYVMKNWESLRSDEVIELGAGCGLAGIVVANLDGPKLVVMTDYDRGSLDLLSENCEINLRQTASATIEVCRLEWGSELTEFYPQVLGYPVEGFRLIIGTDLLYSVDIVSPLLKTVKDLINRDGIFLLVSSFDVGEVIQSEFSRSLLCFGLVAEVRESMSADEHGNLSCRVQYIRPAR